MANEPNQTPDGGGKVAGRTRVSGTGAGGDPTTEPGQYPPQRNDIFGGPLPTGTGAPGTRGGAGGSDVTTQAGQLSGGVAGLTDAQISETGAPGTGTSPTKPGGGESITYTRPGSPYSGTYQSDTTSDNVAGPASATEANDEGYGTGGPQLPGLSGNEPTPNSGPYQPNKGTVMRGGRSVR